MRIKVSFENKEWNRTYYSLKKAKDGIEELHAAGQQVRRIWEVDDQGNKTGKEWSCIWNLELEELKASCTK